METPLQLDTIGVPVSSHLQEIIDGHIKKLESRYGRLTSLRLAIRAPGAHHRMGEPLAVSIHIALPDQREVSVKPVSHNRDPRHGDITFAVNDAFRRATVQLQRHAEELKETPRPRHGPAIGHISRLDREKECGFLTSEDEREIYFHAHSVLGGKYHELNLGDRVAYHEETGLKGPQASTVRLLNGAHLV